MRILSQDDHSLVNSWREEHGEVALDRFPQISLIEPGIAAGGMFLCEEAKIGFLEAFSSNPKAKLRDRYRAIERIAETLIGYGQQLGLRRIYTITKVSGISKMAKRIGLQDRGDFRLLELS